MLNDEDDRPEARDGVRRTISTGTCAEHALDIRFGELKHMDQHGHDDCRSQRAIGDRLWKRLGHRRLINERFILTGLDGAIGAVTDRLRVTSTVGIVAGSEAGSGARLNADQFDP